MRNDKASPIAIATAAIGSAVVIAVSRGTMQGLPAFEIATAVIGGLVFAVLFFGAIHYLLKGWDRLRGR